MRRRHWHHRPVEEGVRGREALRPVTTVAEQYSRYADFAGVLAMPQCRTVCAVSKLAWPTLPTRREQAL